MKNKKPLKFTIAISVKPKFNYGNSLQSTFVFCSEKECEEWFKTEYKVLEKKYSDNIRYEKLILDLPDIGERCHVLGDGLDEYTIMDMMPYSPNRYGFVLDTGCTEEVWKCKRVKDEWPWNK